MSSEKQIAIKVMVIEDNREIREGLKILINGTEGYRCVNAHHSMEVAFREGMSEAPDVVLLDIGLPGMSGIEGIPRLRELYPQASVLMLTVYDDDDRIFQAICAGASGYLLKKTPPVRLMESIQEGANGGAPMSPSIARRVIELFREGRPAPRAEHALTPHEVRLVRLLAEGYNYKTAAEELNVSINTICFHMKNIYQKLHVHSKSEAVAKALRGSIIR